MTIQLATLRVEDADSPLAVWTPRPRFTWNIDPATLGGRTGVRQCAWQLQLLDAEGALVHDTGRVEGSDAVLVDALPHDLEPAMPYRVRVRIWSTDDQHPSAHAGSDADGDSGRDAGGDTAQPTPWLVTDFETARFESAPWHGEWIEPEQVPVTIDGAHTIMESFAPTNYPPASERLHPVQRLRQHINLTRLPVRARLRMTARGVYQAEVNGHPVGDDVLAPGYESYQHYHSVHTHDVTALLTTGENVLGVELGDGWWAGRISILGLSGQYGDRLAATWQLELSFPDGSQQVIGSDSSVVSNNDGPIRYSDIFIGESHDARRADPLWSTAGFDDSAWTPVRTSPVTERLVPFVGEPVRRVMELPAREVLRTPAGETVIDFGQVIAGRVRMRVTAPAGTTITLEHSEVLDEHGNYLNNIGGVNKDQTDHYTARGDAAGEVWEPTFTFHGFRYCRVTGWPGTPDASDFTAVVIASDLRQTAYFECDDPRVTQLHHNAVWSLRGNFLAIPTDCPQRERAGWTGDAQIIMPTAATNIDVLAFMTRWLDNLRADQRDDGAVPIIVPLPPVFADNFAAARRGEGPGGLDAIEAAAGWSDAVVMVPHELWRRYGDTRVLSTNLDAMHAWVEHQRANAEEVLPERLRGRPLSPDQERRQHLLWNGNLNFGDWLAPSTMDAADPHSIMQAPLRTAELVGPMFQAHTLDLMAEICDAVGFADADAHRERAASVRAAFAAEYLDADGLFSDELQGLYVLSLAFDMAPEHLRARQAERLVEMLHANGDRLDTGFLSVPHLLDVLADTGHADLARTLLWQDQCPSWLYEVDRGATTIWEAWDAIGTDGRVGTMSFNHYAFGCVDDWLFRRLAGLRATSTAFATSEVAPDLDCPLGRVSAHIDTPHGRLGVTWERCDDTTVRIGVDVPPNTRSRLVLPQGWQGEPGVHLGSGHHELTVRRN